MRKIIVYNDNLNPNIWDSSRNLDKNVRLNLLKISNDFFKTLNLPEDTQIVDIRILGSSANYNWNEKSDIDVHLVLNFSKIVACQEDADMFNKYVISAAGAWNQKHDIEIKCHGVEMYVQDITKKERSPGVFSLLNNRWISDPKKEHPEIDEKKSSEWYSTFLTKIKESFGSGNVEKMKATLDWIYLERENGLNKTGELDPRNIAFKLLRGDGIISSFKKTISKTYDSNVSLEEIGARNQISIKEFFMT